MSKSRTGSKSLGDAARRTSSKQRKEKLSMQVILLRAGLEEYFHLFERAGYKFMDPSVHQSDMEIEQMLEATEEQGGISFPPDARVRLWKALRYQWFRGPGHIHPFIERSEVPNLFLPKLDYKMVDSMIKIADIDPDRQRQMIRKHKPSGQVGFRGPAVITLQFEVYKRQRDIHYELKDLERCVNEWQNRNPRMMSHEDPREMVLKLRISHLEDAAKVDLEVREDMEWDKWLICMLLFCIRMISGILSVAMFFISIYKFRSTPREIIVGFIVGSNQFQAGLSFLIAFTFVYGVSMRRHPDVLENKLKRMLVSCQRMKESISDFKVETEDFRREDEQPIEGGFGLAGSHSPKSAKKKATKRELGEGARRRGKKSKAKKDLSLAAWCGPDAHKKITDPIDLAEGVQRSLAEAAKRGMEQIPVESANKYGSWGDRQEMMISRARPPEGVEDQLCVRPRPAGLPGNRLQSLALGAPSSEFALPPPPNLPGPPGTRTGSFQLAVRKGTNQDSDGSWPIGSNPGTKERRRALQDAAGSRSPSHSVGPMPPPPAGNRDQLRAAANAHTSPPGTRAQSMGASDFVRSVRSSKEGEGSAWLPGSPQ